MSISAPLELFTQAITRPPASTLAPPDPAPPKQLFSDVLKQQRTRPEPIRTDDVSKIRAKPLVKKGERKSTKTEEADEKPPGAEEPQKLDKTAQPDPVVSDATDEPADEVHDAVATDPNAKTQASDAPDAPASLLAAVVAVEGATQPVATNETPSAGPDDDKLTRTAPAIPAPDTKSAQPVAKEAVDPKDAKTAQVADEAATQLIDADDAAEDVKTANSAKVDETSTDATNTEAKPQAPGKKTIVDQPVADAPTPPLVQSQSSHRPVQHGGSNADAGQDQPQSNTPDATAQTDSSAPSKSEKPAVATVDASALLPTPDRPTPAPAGVGRPAPAVPQQQPEAKFVADNRDNIVQSVKTQLLPNGGTMHIRLDPPELGDLQVTVTMRDGTLTAAFQTSNDAAARMLSHNLGDLKTSLEAAGISVDKLHVQQAPKTGSPDEKNFRDGQNQRDGQTQTDQRSAQQEQQRKEMIRRMWRRLSLGRDELDMVA